jgi:hypothetical protein
MQNVEGKLRNHQPVKKGILWEKNHMARVSTKKIMTYSCESRSWSFSLLKNSTLCPSKTSRVSLHFWDCPRNSLQLSFLAELRLTRSQHLPLYISQKYDMHRRVELTIVLPENLAVNKRKLLHDLLQHISNILLVVPTDSAAKERRVDTSVRMKKILGATNHLRTIHMLAQKYIITNHTIATDSAIQREVHSRRPQTLIPDHLIRPWFAQRFEHLSIAIFPKLGSAKIFRLVASCGFCSTPFVSRDSFSIASSAPTYLTLNYGQIRAPEAAAEWARKWSIGFSGRCCRWPRQQHQSWMVSAKAVLKHQKSSENNMDV